MMKVKSALGLAVVLLTAACERIEMAESVYPDARAAISAGAIQRGWIPAFLPSSAKEINEKHNLDTNEVWLRFSMDPNERSSIEKSCRQIQPAEIILPRKGGGDWWPEVFTEKRRNAQPQLGRYVLYRCENGGYIAVEEDWRRVFYWHHGG